MVDLSPASDLSPKKPPLAPDDSKPDDISSVMKTMKNRESDFEGKVAGAEKELTDIKAKSDALVPPKLDALPEKPQPTYRSPLEAMGSYSGLLAILGGTLTRQPLVASLNAASGVMNAYRAQDMETARNQFDTWKVNTENALKLHNFKMEAYKAALDKSKTDQAGATARFATIARAFGDENAASIAEMNGIEDAKKLVLEQERLADQIQSNMPKVMDYKAKAELWNDLKNSDDYKKATPQERIQMYRDTWGQHAEASINSMKVQAVKDLMAKNPGMSQEDAIKRVEEATKPPPLKTIQSMKADEVDRLIKENPEMTRTEAIAKVESGAKQAQATLSDETTDRIAEQFLAGDKTALQGLGYSNSGSGIANRTKVQEAITRMAAAQGWKGSDIEAKIAEYTGLMSSERSIGTRTAAMDIAANEVKNMAPLALSASEKVNRTKYPNLNSVILAAEKGTGDEDVVRIGLAANSLIYTYSKFLNPTGIPTDADKAKATEILSTAWSKGQFKSAIDQIKKEIQSGQAAIKTTKSDLSGNLTGKESKGTNSSVNLPPEAKAKLKKGVHTTFGNGDTWTLDDNGDPVQVK